MKHWGWNPCLTTESPHSWGVKKNMPSNFARRVLERSAIVLVVEAQGAHVSARSKSRASLPCTNFCLISGWEFQIMYASNRWNNHPYLRILLIIVNLNMALHLLLNICLWLHVAGPNLICFLFLETFVEFSLGQRIRFYGPLLYIIHPQKKKLQFFSNFKMLQQ